MLAHKNRDIAFRVDDAFTRRLRKVVADSGLPLTRFSNSLGYDRKVVYYWLDGRGVPNADALATMRRVYGIDINWLLMGEAL